jgi:hypothetical protein
MIRDGAERTPKRAVPVAALPERTGGAPSI